MTHFRQKAVSDIQDLIVIMARIGRELESKSRIMRNFAEEDDSVWLLSSKNSSRYDPSIFSKEDDEHSVKQAKVFIDDAINYRSIMHSIDPLALKLYRVYFSKPMRLFYFGVIAVLLSLAFFEYQTTLSYTSDTRVKDLQRYNVPCGVTEVIELVCFIVFIGDIILQWRLTGTTRFIKRPWSLIYVGTVTVSVVDLFVSFGFCTNGGYAAYPYRIRRLLRPLLFLQSSSVMKKMVNALKKTLPGILNVLFLLALHLYMYAIIGMFIFQTHCKKENEYAYNCTSHGHKSKKFEECDIGNVTNRTEGFPYFEDLGRGLINMIILLTTANHPDIMLPAYKENRLYSLYFISYLVIGVYILMNVLTAVIYNEFRGFLATSIQSSFTRRRVGQFAAFVILANCTRQVRNIQGSKLEVSKSYIRLLLQHIKLKSNVLGLIAEKLEMLNDDLLTWNQFKGIFVALWSARTLRWRKKQEFKFSSYRSIAWIQYVLQHKYCTFVSIGMSVLNCIIISLMVLFRCDLDYEDTHPNYNLGIINLIFLPYYILECLVYISFLGRYYLYQWRNLYDLFSAALIICGDIALLCVIRTIDANIYVGTVYLKEASKVIQVTHIFIMLRLLRIIPHMSALRHIANTIIHLIRNLRAYVGLMICVYYFFAILGMIVFRGVSFSPSDRNELYVRFSEQCGTYEQANYYPNNFDDFGSSLVVLYDVMVVNNWYIFLYAYGRKVPYSQAFFIIWWLIASVVGLSLLVAFLLEAFITKWEATKKLRLEATNDTKSNEVEDMEFDRMLEEEDVVDLLKGELKEPEDEELIRELLRHNDLKLKF